MILIFISIKTYLNILHWIFNLNVWILNKIVSYWINYTCLHFLWFGIMHRKRGKKKTKKENKKSKLQVQVLNPLHLLNGAKHESGTIFCETLNLNGLFQTVIGKFTTKLLISTSSKISPHDIWHVAFIIKATCK